ncbi:haloalkane dehalogenase [Leptospira perolatii]|uniref:Haloalkane dehalogenase n=1 Tax=Leptospira perolatii TaxID=2023191 RepID=A0A2M9ZPF9_9LEPT|nr:haloalkane dehalogenase [Leptospira perolatii]PJZ70685.1 haloalkane dehalogenase [Leptospira perolatii]PJZ73895.1 haloalkane dehalogenase [Leptospira perolatii]
MQKVLKTPEQSFNNLPDYPFQPNFVKVGDLRMHYLNEGDKNSSETILLLHGEPSWSYLYRKMIPKLSASSFRVVTPDLIGFGKSDKPVQKEIFTYQQHVDWLIEFIDTLNLKNITLFCQDWGGLLGLRAAVAREHLFKRICASNTFLPTGDNPPKEAFLKWLSFSQKVKNLPIAKIIQSGCVSELRPEVLKAYAAPYPDESYKAAARMFPTLVPITPDNPASQANRDAWQILRNWRKPFLTAFSDSDDLTKGGDIFFRRLIPGTKGQKHTTIEKAGHFLQEDKGEELAQVLIDFISSNPG